jgi:peptidoglycan/LPS O-acetylase OafA/YrhL
MKDLVKRGIVMAIFLAFLFYLLSLIIQGQAITTPEYANLNVIIYSILIALCVYLVVFYGVYPIHIKFSRPGLLVVGLALIVFSQTIMRNNGSEGVFMGDIFSVAGVIILILFPTNLLTTEKVKKHKTKKNEVVIEV